MKGDWDLQSRCFERFFFSVPHRLGCLRLPLKEGYFSFFLVISHICSKNQPWWCLCEIALEYKVLLEEATFCWWGGTLIIHEMRRRDSIAVNTCIWSAVVWFLALNDPLSITGCSPEGPDDQWMWPWRPPSTIEHIILAPKGQSRTTSLARLARKVYHEIMYETCGSYDF